MSVSKAHVTHNILAHNVEIKRQKKIQQTKKIEKHFSERFKRALKQVLLFWSQGEGCHLSGPKKIKKAKFGHR